MKSDLRFLSKYYEILAVEVRKPLKIVVIQMSCTSLELETFSSKVEVVERILGEDPNKETEIFET
jgi:hypothetical protein